MRRVEKIAGRRLLNTDTNKGPKTRHADKRASSLGIEACDVCHVCFYSKNSLAVHKRIHIKDQIFTCDVCEKRFMTSAALRSHKKTHRITDEDNHFCCNVCDRKYTNEISLDMHIRISHTKVKRRAGNKGTGKDNSPTPQRIKEVTSTSKGDSVSKRKSKSQQNSASKRNSVSKRNSESKRHSASKRKSASEVKSVGKRHSSSEEDSSSDQQSMSDWNYSSDQDSLSEHNSSGERDLSWQSNSSSDKLSCSICHEKFSSAVSLRNHKTHTKGGCDPHSKKVVSCFVCNEKFSSNTLIKSTKMLRKHMESHKDDKGHFKCLLCPKSFTSSISLSNHGRSHSIKFIDRQCQICKKVFQSVEKLAKHSKCCVVLQDKVAKTTTKHTLKASKSLRVHLTRVPESPATVPTKRSRRTPGSSNSAKNVLFNMDENFKCGICTKEFSSKRHLEIHKRKHLKDGEDSESIDIDMVDPDDVEKCKQSLVLVVKLDDKILDAVENSVSALDNSGSTDENDDIIVSKNDDEVTRKNIELSNQSKDKVGDHSEEIIVEIDNANKISIEKEFAKDCGFAIDSNSAFTASSENDIEVVPINTSLNTVEVEVSVVELNNNTTADTVPLVFETQVETVNSKLGLDMSSEICNDDITNTTFSANVIEDNSISLKNNVDSPSGKLTNAIICTEKTTRPTIISLKAVTNEKQNSTSTVSKEKENCDTTTQKEKKTNTSVLTKEESSTTIQSDDNEISSKETEEKPTNPSTTTENPTNPSLLSEENHTNSLLLSTEKQGNVKKDILTTIEMEKSDVALAKDIQSVLLESAGESPLSNGGKKEIGKGSTVTLESHVNDDPKTGENNEKMDEQKESENPELKGIIDFINNDFSVDTSS